MIDISRLQTSAARIEADLRDLEAHVGKEVCAKLHARLLREVGTLEEVLGVQSGTIMPDGGTNKPS